MSSKFKNSGTLNLLVVALLFTHFSIDQNFSEIIPLDISTNDKTLLNIRNVINRKYAVSGFMTLVAQCILTGLIMNNNLFVGDK